MEESIPDLVSVLLHLAPQEAAGRGAQALPDWWGRAAHRLFLDVVAAANPRLAEKLHAQPGQKRAAAEDEAGFTSLRPFTASTLYGQFRRGRLDEAETYTLRLSACSADLAMILLGALQAGPLSVGQRVELDFIPFLIRAVEPDPQFPPRSPWAGLSRYEYLASWLHPTAPAAPDKIRLELLSPTAVKSGGMHLPLPLPELIFGSLLDRWNAFSSTALPAEAREYARDCLAISRFNLSSELLRTKSRGRRIGSVGTVTYTCLEYERYWMGVLHALADFALYAGVGVGTSMGMGQARKVSQDEPG